MQLAKEHLDVGLFTNHGEESLRFWQEEVGLPFEETLPVGEGIRQHRHTMNGSVLKLNESRDRLPDVAPSGYRELLIAREGLEAMRCLVDPDGNPVTLVPRGHDGIDGIAVVVAARSFEASMRYYTEVLGWERVSESRVRCGRSLLLLEEDPSQAPVGDLRGVGYRYLTVQVFDVDAEHAAILARGGREGRPPVTLGSTARISFVRDPDGNWLEISQRASLTGRLPG